MHPGPVDHPEQEVLSPWNALALPTGTPLEAQVLDPRGAAQKGAEAELVRPAAPALIQSLSWTPATQRPQTHICDQTPQRLTLVRVKRLHFLGCCHPTVWPSESLDEMKQEAQASAPPLNPPRCNWGPFLPCPSPCCWPKSRGSLTGKLPGNVALAN